MAFQATYFLPLSLGLACVEPVRDCILVPAWGTDPAAPPCMRHRVFPPTAGAMQGLPERVFAPQRRLASIGPVLRLCVAIGFSAHS
jgi:hypothetical protein